MILVCPKYLLIWVILLIVVVSDFHAILISISILLF